MFADMRAAYDALPARRCSSGSIGSSGLHGRTDGPDAVRVYGTEYARNSGKARPERRHPRGQDASGVAGRVLFVNPTHTHGFEGMDETAAVTLIAGAPRPRHPDRDSSTTTRGASATSSCGDELATMHRSAGDARPARSAGSRSGRSSIRKSRPVAAAAAGGAG